MEAYNDTSVKIGIKHFEQIKHARNNVTYTNTCSKNVPTSGLKNEISSVNQTIP